MIISASRRTDIPNYYSEWFLNRIKEGYLYVRNPMNPCQISKIPLSPELVDCIVFWTKNPEPMLGRLEALKDYRYYFQFTLTGYGRDIEAGIPHKKNNMIPVFQRLSRMIGKERVIWRYDPILFTDRYTPDYHLSAFEQIAEALQEYTSKCVISFDLSACGIAHNCCIDKELIERLTGCRIKAEKDKNQRKECGCIESIDIGAYNTCKSGCLYCYAGGNLSRKEDAGGTNAASGGSLYDVCSPLLCGKITEADRVAERKVKSWKESQRTVWD